MDFSPPEALRLVQAYVAASQPLNRSIEGAQAFVLLSAAAEAGMLDAARSPSSTSEIAATTGLDPAWVSDLTVALEAYGIFDRDGDRYHLSQDFALLASPDALLPSATCSALAGSICIPWKPWRQPLLCTPSSRPRSCSAWRMGSERRPCPPSDSWCPHGWDS